MTAQRPLIGIVLWGQFPDELSWIGIAIVCGSGIAIALFEWRSQHNTTPVAANPE